MNNFSTVKYRNFFFTAGNGQYLHSSNLSKRCIRTYLNMSENQGLTLTLFFLILCNLRKYIYLNIIDLERKYMSQTFAI